MGRCSPALMHQWGRLADCHMGCAPHAYQDKRSHALLPSKPDAFKSGIVMLVARCPGASGTILTPPLPPRCCVEPIFMFRGQVTKALIVAKA
eukprot:365644-Chlamydomonas_euryale.AAC.7